MILHLQDVYWSGEGQLSVRLIGAVRLARPASIWSRHAYHGKRLDEATNRAAAFDRRWRPVRTDWDDFIGGRPS